MFKSKYNDVQKEYKLCNLRQLGLNAGLLAQKLS